MERRRTDHEKFRCSLANVHQTMPDLALEVKCISLPQEVFLAVDGELNLSGDAVLELLALVAEVAPPFAPWRDGKDQRAEPLIREPVRQKLDGKRQGGWVNQPPMFLRAEDDARRLMLLIQEELDLLAQALRDPQDCHQGRRDLVALDLLDGARGDSDLLAELPKRQPQLPPDLPEFPTYVEDQLFDHIVSGMKQRISYACQEEKSPLQEQSLGR